METSAYFLTQQMEEFIDSHSLEALLSLISDLCHEKAAHVADNWQDKGLAKQWEKRAKAIESCEASID